MNTRKSLISCLIYMVGVTAGWAQLPHLEKTNVGLRLYVDGKPFVALAGELHNSSTGSATYMSGIWKRMAENNLNTVICPVTWELLEPQEGKYDFTQVDSMLEGAAKNNLRLIILWFGSWKNGNSSYAPGWVKENPSRFPLVNFSNGDKTNTLSTLGKTTMEAESKAFATLMNHFKQVDWKHTVIAIQVENEMGTLDIASAFMHKPILCARDFSSLANKAYADQVPPTLLQYLKKYEKTLSPAVAAAWKKNGKKMKGSWEEVFGKNNDTIKVSSTNQYAKESWQNTYPNLTNELFNAWNYASYVDYIAAKGKAVYNIPMYVNCWQKQARQNEPGAYPSGGPQFYLKDIYRAAAPHIDLLEPDLYNAAIYDYVMTGYDQPGNPILLPETSPGPDGAARAFYTFGRYHTICYSPFGVDGNGLSLNPEAGDESLKKTYLMLKNLTPLINKYYGTDKINGMLLDKGRKSDHVVMGNYKIYTAGFRNSSSEALTGVASKESKIRKDNVSGIIIFQTDKNEFVVAGGVGSAMISFSLAKAEKNVHTGLASVDEILFREDGSYDLHRLNGDETAYGGVIIRDGEVRAFKVKLYQY